MTTAYTEYANSIIEQFVSGKWKYNPEFKKLSIHELNSAIVEAEHRLIYVLKELNENNRDVFYRLVTFIKANIPFTADEILMDMYNSHMRYWIPHPTLLSMTTPQLNTFLLDKLIEFQDKKIPYDIVRFNNLSMFLKSFIK